jgi:hypothetical protein
MANEKGGKTLLFRFIGLFIGMTEQDVRKLIRESLMSLDESRMTTFSLEIMGKIHRAIPELKPLDIRSMSDGTAGLFRYEKDGNAYEIEIRPASLIKDKDFWGAILKKKEPHPMKDIYKLINKNQK